MKLEELLNQRETKLLETTVAQLICPSKQDTLVTNAVRKLDIHTVIYSRVLQKVTKGRGVLENS